MVRRHSRLVPQQERKLRSPLTPIPCFGIDGSTQSCLHPHPQEFAHLSSSKPKPQQNTGQPFPEIDPKQLLFQPLSIR